MFDKPDEVISHFPVMQKFNTAPTWNGRNTLGSVLNPTPAHNIKLYRNPRGILATTHSTDTEMTWSLQYDFILRRLSDLNRINTERRVNTIRNGRFVFPFPAAAKFEMVTKHGSSPELRGHTAWAKKMPYMASRNSYIVYHLRPA